MLDNHTAEARRLADELQAMGWEFVTEPAWNYYPPVMDDFAMMGVDY